MARPSVRVVLNEHQKRELEQLATKPTSPQQMAFRARVVLTLGQGRSSQEVAKRLKTSEQTVCLWKARFLQGGVGALQDAPRSGRPTQIPASVRRRIVTRCVQPPGKRARWTTRSMAKSVGVSKDTVQRLWSRNAIKPHRVRTFKLSTDEHFEEKFWDVIGLYLNPPLNAVVLCCDEKSQCQALQRTQPGLPLNVGHIRTRTHDYYRNGTITLFAALNYLTGKIISQTSPRHRHGEWLAFLKKIDSEIAPKLEIHIVCDNYATHKHPSVKRWIERHRRFHMHFTPTSASWMNMVERFFRDISQQAILPGSFGSVHELVETIATYLREHNLEPRRYQWRADGKEVLAKIERAWDAATNIPKIVPKVI
jgi:transposase